MKTREDDTTYDHRRDEWPRGVWFASKSPIDRVLRYVLEELGLTERGGLSLLLDKCNIAMEVVTRHRRDKRAALLQHLAALSLYSGIPLPELCELGCVTYNTHIRARG